MSPDQRRTDLGDHGLIAAPGRASDLPLASAPDSDPAGPGSGPGSGPCSGLFSGADLRQAYGSQALADWNRLNPLCTRATALAWARADMWDHGCPVAALPRRGRARRLWLAPDAQGVLGLAEGTLVATAAGPVPVEMLRAGDQVITPDHGAQPLVWVGSSQIDAARLWRNDVLQPIRLARDSLGPGLPARDIWVSRRQEVLIAGHTRARLPDQTQAMLVAAQHLRAWPGIGCSPRFGGLRYWHLALAMPGLVLAEGLPVASLCPGPHLMIVLDRAQQADLMLALGRTPFSVAAPPRPRAGAAALGWRTARPRVAA